MKPHLTWGIVATATVLALATPGWAADDKQKLDGQEIAFLRQRAQDDIFMWKLGEFAAQHGATDRVKQLGEAIVKERRTDLRDIQKIADDHGADIKVPDSLNAAQKTKFDQMTRQGGVTFDKGFTKEVVTNYSTAIPQLKREKDRAGHVDVREYAGKNLTMFEDHQKEAKDAEKEVWK